MISPKCNSMVYTINTKLHKFYSDPNKLRFQRLRGLIHPPPKKKQTNKQTKHMLDDGILLNIDAMKIYAVQIQLGKKNKNLNVDFGIL